MSERLINISNVNLRVHFGAVCFGNVTYNPGGVCGPRVQNDFQLVLIHSGNALLYLDEKKIQIPANHAILLSPGKTEYFRFSQNSQTYHSWCAISPRAIPPELKRELIKQTGVLPITPRIMHLYDFACKGLARYGDAAPSIKRHWALSLGIGLLSEFIFGHPIQNDSSMHKSTTLKRAEMYIFNEYALPLTLTNIAQYAGVSKQHLLKIFRESCGMSPIKLLYQRRLNKASELLNLTGLSISEISDQCGFLNPFHFSRKFRQQFNLSPREFRRKLWSKKSR